MGAAACRPCATAWLRQDGKRVEGPVQGKVRKARRVGWQGKFTWAVEGRAGQGDGGGGGSGDVGRRSRVTAVAGWKRMETWGGRCRRPPPFCALAGSSSAITMRLWARVRERAPVVWARRQVSSHSPYFVQCRECRATRTGTVMGPKMGDGGDGAGDGWQLRTLPEMARGEAAALGREGRGRKQGSSVVAWRGE